MKSLGTILVLGTVFCLATSADASPVLVDTFTRPVGNLVGTLPDVGTVWTAHSGAGAMPIQIIADNPPLGAPNAIELNQGSGSREDANAGFLGGETAGEGSKYWAGYCVKVTGTDPLTNVYFAHFSDAGTSAFQSRVGVTDPSVTDFQLGLFSSGTTVAVVWPTPLLYDNWYRVVTAYEFDTGLNEMWIDPDPTKGPYDPGQVPVVSYAGSALTGIKAYAFRQASGNSTQRIDNLFVGNNVADWPVVASPCIPEPTTLALLAIGGLALVRRRR